jgi:hypothetical protein
MHFVMFWRDLSELDLCRKKAISKIGVRDSLVSVDVARDQSAAILVMSKIFPPGQIVSCDET